MLGVSPADSTHLRRSPQVTLDHEQLPGWRLFALPSSSPFYLLPQMRTVVKGRSMLPCSHAPVSSTASGKASLAPASQFHSPSAHSSFPHLLPGGSQGILPWHSMHKPLSPHLMPETQRVPVPFYDPREKRIWERKTMCPQAKSASKIAASDLLSFCKSKRGAARMVQSFHFSCGGSVWALPCQVLKLCGFIKHSRRSSLPVIYVPKQMYC